MLRPAGEVAAMDFCMGGSIALRSAASLEGLAAAVGCVFLPRPNREFR
jgi:dienelactone hydrolase